MPSYHWIFFDLFDTLCTVDESRYYEGKRKGAEAAGVDFSAFIEAWKRTSPDASVGKLRTPYDRAEKALGALGVKDRKVVAEVARLDVETIQDCVGFYGGAEDCLRILRSRGFDLGLISNATATTAFAIGSLGLRALLQCLVFSYEAGVAKPDPAIYQLALRRTGCTPREALFVGDGANRELDAAAAQGWGTLCMDHPLKAFTFRNPDTLSRPDHWAVRSFEALLALPELAAPGRDD